MTMTTTKKKTTTDPQNLTVLELVTEIRRIEDFEVPRLDGDPSQVNAYERRSVCVHELCKRVVSGPRKLTAEEVAFEEGIEEEFVPVRDCFDIGDERPDELLQRLEGGDTSAWCTLVVYAKWNGFVSHVSLGGYSFPEGQTGEQNREYAANDFQELRVEALAALNSEIAAAYTNITNLA